MNSITKKLTLCALLAASMNAHAAFVPFLDGEFTSGQGSWGEDGSATFTYPVSGGNPGGYGVINHNGGGGGLWVSSNNSGTFLPLPTGLVAGNGYHFKMDMRLEAGSSNSNIGGLKLEWQGAGDTGDIRIPYLGAGWKTYTFDAIIPAGVTGMKVVPLWGPNSIVGFDNIGFDNIPYYVAPPPPAPPSDVIFQDFFAVAGNRWGSPTFNGTGNSGSLAWSNTEGNPQGSTILTATNPTPSAGNGFYTYTATGVNFGDGPVEISFDAKASLVGSALHVIYNGNQVLDIQNLLNGSTYTTVKKTFQLNQGFGAINTFTLQFQIAMGPVNGGGGTVTIDNIIVKTNLPPTTFSAVIKTGKAVSWTPPNGTNAYQAQKSTKGVIFTDVGPLIIGNTQNAIFDSPGAPFYQVLQSVPFFTEDIVYNGGFETESGYLLEADGWGSPWNQFATRIITGAHTGTACMQLKALNVADEANASETHQNTLNAGGPAITTGGFYTLKFWSKQISSGPSYEQQYRVSWLAEGGGEVLAGIWQPLPIGTTGLWTERTLTGLVAPAGAVTAYIQIVGTTGAVTGGFGEVHIDDVSLFSTYYDNAVVLPGTTVVSSVEVSWASTLAKNYQVQTSGNLTSWADFGGVVAGTGSILKVNDTMVDPKKFYKVAKLP